MINGIMTQNNMNLRNAQAGMMTGAKETASRVCVATFSTTSDASAFKKLCEMYWIPARLMPVPVSLNSDCSTCVEFELNGCIPFSLASLPEKPARYFVISALAHKGTAELCQEVMQLIQDLAEQERESGVDAAARDFVWTDKPEPVKEERPSDIQEDFEQEIQ